MKELLAVGLAVVVGLCGATGFRRVSSFVTGETQAQRELMDGTTARRMEIFYANMEALGSGERQLSEEEIRACLPN